MLGRLIGLMIFPMIVYFTIYPMLTQEVYNAVNCNSSSYSPIGNTTTLRDFFPETTQSPPGETGSFGGAGGQYHFGGYSGEVAHKDFISSHAIIQTNRSSFFNPTCEALDESQRQMLSNVPLLFLISSGVVAWFWYRNFFRSSFIDDI